MRPSSWLEDCDWGCLVARPITRDGTRGRSNFVASIGLPTPVIRYARWPGLLTGM